MLERNWLENKMNGSISDSDTSRQNLSQTTFNKYYYFIIVPCEIGSYKIQTIGYDRDSIIAIDASKEFKKQVNISVSDDLETFSEMLSFLKTEVDKSEEIRLNTFPDFISSVGENLGLFTRFSFLAAILTFHEWLQACIV